ncbi:MAG: hypothetical protein MH204_05850 [Fimbriimonadaceae bacterium]|nr:hypothetical protein [Fimbriimonadaceae bacterium]
MQIRFAKTLWGWESHRVEVCRDWILEDGYDGVEAPMWTLGRPDFWRAAGLAVIVQAFPMSPEEVQTEVEKAAAYEPVLINLHVGKDWWPEDRADALLQTVAEADSPAPICVETHRGRLFHHPVDAMKLLARHPEIRLTADLSHWTCVCESMLDDQPEAVAAAVARTAYLHARVGHEEGPQVPDPRAAAWVSHTERFEAIWDRIIAAARGRGESEFWVDPEFGPPNYMWTSPTSGEPLADQREVSRWMKDRLRTRWT